MKTKEITQQGLTYKGTRITLGSQKRELIDELVKVAISWGYDEIHIPIIQYQSTFKGKVGEENQHMMFDFADRKGREICLAPEYTAVIQQLAITSFKYEKDLCLFYVQECFRGENPQKGRYRQFTQMGLETINPTDPEETLDTMMNIAEMMVSLVTPNYAVDSSVKRGLDYYKNGQGFEIRCTSLGTQQQIVGGGIYDGGVGFAIGIDRLLII